MKGSQHAYASIFLLIHLQHSLGEVIVSYWWVLTKSWGPYSCLGAPKQPKID